LGLKVTKKGPEVPHAHALLMLALAVGPNWPQGPLWFSSSHDMLAWAKEALNCQRTSLKAIFQNQLYSLSAVETAARTKNLSKFSKGTTAVLQCNLLSGCDRTMAHVYSG